MAETTAEPIKTAETVPVEPPKRGRGRPPLSREGIEPQQPLPPKEADDESFFSWIGSFTEQEWNDSLFLYLYRCEPITDRKQTGNRNYIIKYTKPVDPQQVMEEYGSGKYLVVLNRFNPQTRKYAAIENHYFKVLNSNYPPKIPFGEWVDDERNAEWQWAKPQLQAEHDKMKSAQGGGSGGGGFSDGVAMFNAVMAGVEKLRPNQSPEEQKTLAHLVIQTLEKNSDKMLALATNQTGAMDIVDKVLSVIKPGDGGSVMQLITAQLTALQAELSAERQFNRELLTKMSTTEPKRSLKEELGDVKEISQMFRGGGGAAAGTDWAQVALQMGSKVLDVGGAIAAAIIAGKGQKPPARPAVTVNTSPVLPQPVAPEPTPAPTEMPSNLTQEQQQMFSQLETINNQFGWMFDMVTPFLVEHFHKSDGLEFRDWFLSEHGDFSYRQIKQFAPETIIGIFELRKQVAPDNIRQQLVQLQPMEKVQKFVLEFLSDEPVEEEEDEDPEKPGAPGESRGVGGKDF